jgi:type II secretory pathway pseudopilin PulG
VRRSRGAGFTLLEAIVFIVVLSVLLAGLATSLRSSLHNAPIASQMDIASELAQQRMELILGQRRAAGFAAFADPCPGPAACTPPAGYTVTAAIAAGGNSKTITVNVTGTWAASATTVVTNH